MVMPRKRSITQEAFDRAKHGWAFCNNHMLLSRILDCENIAKLLDPSDERHATVKAMREAYNKAEGN